MIVLSDGSLLFVGTAPNQSPPPPGGFIYDLDSGLSRPIRTQASRWQPALALLADGRVLIAGGTTTRWHPRAVEILDPVSGESNVVGE